MLEVLPDSVLGKPAVAKTRAKAKAIAPLPETLSPQLATLAASPPEEAADWLWELKFDGYRLLTRIDSGKVTCFTRNGHDWTEKLPELETALSRLGVRSAWMDGEIVVHDERGAPDFQALQNAFDRRSTASIVYWVFDLLFLDGEDLRELPWKSDVRVSHHFWATTKHRDCGSARRSMHRRAICWRRSAPWVSRD